MPESKFLYENGLPFTAGFIKEVGKDCHAYNLDQLEVRRQKKKPTIIIVDGMSGEGKTTMSVHTVDYLERKKADLEAHVLLGGMKFMKGLKEAYLKNLKIVIYTEAGDFDKKATLSKFVRTLDRVFETYRTYNVIVIVDLPYMPKLPDGIFEKGLPRMLIHCEGRQTYGNFKVYDLKEMMWLRAWARDKRVKNKQDIYRIVEPNYVGHFKDLEPERSRLLDRLCTSGKSEILELAEIQGEDLLSYADLAAKLNRTHEWVRKKVKDLGLKPVKIWKGKNYYDQDAFMSLKKVKAR